MPNKNYIAGGCPRCGGDIVIDKAFDEPVEACIRCGYYKYLDDVTEAEKADRAESYSTSLK